MPQSRLVPIILSAENYCRELEELAATSGFPWELATMLKGLVTATINDVCPPEAKPNLIALAKEHLKGGITIGKDTVCSQFSVVVFVAKDQDVGRTFFSLVPRYNNCILRRLDEF